MRRGNALNEHARNAKVPPGRERGFTFVELVVVLVIAGVVAAVPASRWSATAPYQGELLARSLRHMEMQLRATFETWLAPDNFDGHGRQRVGLRQLMQRVNQYLWNPSALDRRRTSTPRAR